MVKIQSAKGQNYQKAFGALLLVVNEKGDVVDFIATAGQSLKDDSVQEMLHSIKDKSPDISLIMAGQN